MRELEVEKANNNKKTIRNPYLAKLRRTLSPPAEAGTHETLPLVFKWPGPESLLHERREEEGSG